MSLAALSGLVLALERLIPLFSRLVDLAFELREEAKARAAINEMAAKDARNAKAIADALAAPNTPPDAPRV